MGNPLRRLPLAPISDTATTAQARKRLRRPLRLSRRRAAATRSLPAMKLPRPAPPSTLPQLPAAPPSTSRRPLAALPSTLRRPLAALPSTLHPPPAQPLSTSHQRLPVWPRSRAPMSPLPQVPRLRLPLTPPLAQHTPATSLTTRRVLALAVGLALLLTTSSPLLMESWTTAPTRTTTRC